MITGISKAVLWLYGQGELFIPLLPRKHPQRMLAPAQKHLHPTREFFRQLSAQNPECPCACSQSICGGGTLCPCASLCLLSALNLSVVVVALCVPVPALCLKPCRWWHFVSLLSALSPCLWWHFGTLCLCCSTPCGTPEDHPRTQECSTAGLEWDPAQTEGVGISNKKLEMTFPYTAAAASELPGHHQLLTRVCATHTTLLYYASLIPRVCPRTRKKNIDPKFIPRAGNCHICPDKSTPLSWVKRPGEGKAEESPFLRSIYL